MSRSRLALGVLAGAVAAILVFTGTRENAPGLALDGVTYMSAADALVHTGELRVPFSRWFEADSTSALSRWPPGLPVLIAIPHFVGIPILAGARGVLMLSALLTVFGLVLLADRVAGKAAAVIAALLLIASPDLARLHTSVWSEPPFLVCVVALLAAFVLAADRPLLHGVLAALGVLLRYAGIALGAAAAVWALVRPGNWRARIRGAALAGLPSVLAQLWWTRHISREGAEAIRPFSITHLGRSVWMQAAESVRDWLAPVQLASRLQYSLAVLVAIVSFGLFAVAVRRLRVAGERVRPGANAPEARLYAAAALLAVVYTVFIVAAKICADGWITFDGRLFSPVIVLAEAAVAVALGAWWVRSAPAGRAVAGVAVALWAACGLTTSTAEARIAMRDGRYMTYGYWRTSALLNWVRRDGRQVPIYSNYPSAVFMYAHRSARESPSLGEFPHVRDFAATLARTGGVFVAFDMPSPWLLPNEALAKYLSLREVARFPDGAVWAAPDSTPP
jgi:dolichyl-phosphate-mannose-protein mannosyltransferase